MQEVHKSLLQTNPLPYPKDLPPKIFDINEVMSAINNMKGNVIRLAGMELYANSIVDHMLVHTTYITNMLPLVNELLTNVYPHNKDFIAKFISALYLKGRKTSYDEDLFENLLLVFKKSENKDVRSRLKEYLENLPIDLKDEGVVEFLEILESYDNPIQ